MSQVQANEVLKVENIRKTFGGITAVDGVSFSVRQGEILGIIGPNGSGKPRARSGLMARMCGACVPPT
jgi:ABC-type branched-subunit amino acid transport system ATPase component